MIIICVLDFNECDYPGYCDQGCKKKNGDYLCSCVPGYRWDMEGRCHAVNGEYRTNKVFLLKITLTGDFFYSGVTCTTVNVGETLSNHILYIV